MAIFYETEKNDRVAIYEAAEKWKNECLLNDKSLIWDGESIWTDANFNRFRSIFVDNPDESGDNFDSKFKKQLENESEGVYKFAIELMFIYYIFPYNGSISYKTKMKKLEMIASWKGIEFNPSFPIFDALKDGLGATGTFYNTSKYFEVSFLFLVAEKLKKLPLEKRKEILNNASELKKTAEDTRKLVGKRVQIMHILLHLLLPVKFERIASWGHKYMIAKAYSELIMDNSITDTDEKLLMIREKLQTKYPNEDFDFYETPGIEDEWRASEKTIKKLSQNENVGIPVELEPDSVNNIPSVNFDVHPFQNGLIFENLDVLLDQVMTAIRNGKHIILTGPPGTGKSKLASKICEMYSVQSKMVTASSNWSTYETIGGYRPDSQGNLYFNEGIFLECVKEKETNQPKNNWLIIDEINRSDIDKAFGSLFSVLTGDEVTLPFQSKSGKTIVIKPQGKVTTNEPNDYTFIIPNDWRIIATMNTLDKASLYEMSYAFMRRFAFIPVGIPKNITSELIEQYLDVWDMNTYPNVDILESIWKLINNFRKIGPAIVKDIAKHTQDNDDFTSAIILYVLPQFEGLPVNKIKEFITRLVDDTDAIIDRNQLDDFMNDFFDAGAFE
jgi:energy-coupling factor transporter ATP-binding protein EcfA2